MANWQAAWHTIKPCELVAEQALQLWLNIGLRQLLLLLAPVARQASLGNDEEASSVSVNVGEPVDGSAAKWQFRVGLSAVSSERDI